MDFVRSGWRDAQPRFQPKGSNRMVNAVDLVTYEVEYRDDITGIANPDAEFIAHSWQDVHDLLALVDDLQRENAALTATLEIATRALAVNDRPAHTHANAACGVCGGPLEEDRDAVCHACSQALRGAPMSGARLWDRGECSQCLQDRFLRPVDVFPGFAGPDCLVTLWLCLDCRLNLRDDRWVSLVSTFLHHVRRETRECAQWALEWKEASHV
jgi:hypothetical protein